MRVLFLAHSFPRFVGDSAGSFVLRLAQALQARGIDVEAVVPHAAGLAEREAIEGVPVHRFRYAPDRHETLAYTGTMAEQVRGRLGGQLALAAFLAAGTGAAIRQARALAPDVVHAHWWFPAGLSGVAAAAATNVPLVTTVHGSDVRLARGTTGGAALLRGVVRQSVELTAVSRWLATEVQRLAPRARPTVAPMPVDVERFTPADCPARGRLLFVGRLNQQKGLDKLLRALGTLPAAPAVDVVGQGPDEQALRALAADLGVGPRVTWHASHPPARLAELYRHAAALVVPSSDEGLGLVAVEAQLSGTPVIAFASGGLTDIVTDGTTGLLVPPGDVGALAGAIDRVLGNPQLTADLSRAGRAAALQRFSPAAVADRYASVYRAAVDRRAA